MRHSRNYIRAEVERMPWPEVISDEAADTERELARLRREVGQWCTLAVCLLCVLAMIVAEWMS